MTIESINKFVIEKVLEKDDKKDNENVFQTFKEKDLLLLRDDFIKIIQKIWEVQYEFVLDILDGMTEFKIQKVDYVNWSDEQFEKYTKKISLIIDNAGNLGAGYQDVINSKVGLSMDVQADGVKSRAEQHAAELVSQIDDTTKKRLNKLISNALDEGITKSELKKILQTDYGFSKYRANLIVNNELKKAYIQGQKIQFAERQKESGLRGYKDWISHRDDRVTQDCYENDMQGEIPFDDLFQSGAEEPPRFPGCRCSIAYLPYSTEELLEESVEDYINEDQLFDEYTKPINYDKISTKVLPAKFFNAAGERVIYREGGDDTFYAYKNKIINFGKDVEGKGLYKIYAEVHEAGHFLEDVLLSKRVNRSAEFRALRLEIRHEIDDNWDVIAKFFPKKSVNAMGLFWTKSELNKFKKYLILDKNTEIGNHIIYVPKYSEAYKWDYLVVADLIGTVSSGNLGAGHPISYYIDESRMWCELMAAVNTIYYLDNKILEVLLPNSYKLIRNFYNSLNINI